MTVTLDLPTYVEQGLREQATDRGVAFEEYVAQVLIDVVASPASAIPIGQQILDAWREDGVLGLFSDRPDSVEFARQLRAEAEARQ